MLLFVSSFQGFFFPPLPHFVWLTQGCLPLLFCHKVNCTSFIIWPLFWIISFIMSRSVLVASRSKSLNPRSWDIHSGKINSDIFTSMGFRVTVLHLLFRVQNLRINFPKWSLVNLVTGIEKILLGSINKEDNIMWHWLESQQDAFHPVGNTSQWSEHFFSSKYSCPASYLIITATTGRRTRRSEKRIFTYWAQQNNITKCFTRRMKQ